MNVSEKDKRIMNIDIEYSEWNTGKGYSKKIQLTYCKPIIIVNLIHMDNTYWYLFIIFVDNAYLYFISSLCYNEQWSFVWGKFQQRYMYKPPKV